MWYSSFSMCFYNGLMGILMEWSTYSSVQYSRFSLALRPSRSVRAPMDPRVAFSQRKNRIPVLSSETSDIMYRIIMVHKLVFYSILYDKRIYRIIHESNVHYPSTSPLAVLPQDQNLTGQNTRIYKVILNNNS